MDPSLKTKCVNCNSTGFKNYLELNGYSYKRCNSCELVQLSPLPTIEELKVFYDSNYYEYNFDEKSSDLKAIVKEQNSVQYDVTQRNFEVNHTTKFLDYGCGVGGFLDTVSAKGNKNIFGFEFNEISAKLIRDKGYGYVDVYKDEQTFDVITMWDVAEHLLEPIEVFKLLRSRLNKGGVLIIGTARIDDFVDRTGFGYTMWADPPAHTILYSKKLLFSILNKAGFNEVKEDTQHSISNIYTSKTKMIKRLIKKLIFWFKTDRVNKRELSGSYLVMVAKK